MSLTISEGSFFRAQRSQCSRGGTLVPPGSVPWALPRRGKDRHNDSRAGDDARPDYSASDHPAAAVSAARYMRSDVR